MICGVAPSGEGDGKPIPSPSFVQWLLYGSVSYVCFGREKGSVAVVDHNGYDERIVFVKRALVDAQVWGFDGGDNSCWVIAVRKSLAFAV